MKHSYDGTSDAMSLSYLLITITCSFRVVPEDGSPRGMEEHEYLKRKKVVQLRVITVRVHEADENG